MVFAGAVLPCILQVLCYPVFCKLSKLSTYIHICRPLPMLTDFQRCWAPTAPSDFSGICGCSAYLRRSNHFDITLDTKVEDIWPNCYEGLALRFRASVTLFQAGSLYWSHLQASSGWECGESAKSQGASQPTQGLCWSVGVSLEECWKQLMLVTGL